MGDDLVAVRRNEDVPHGVGRRSEIGDGVVEFTDQAGHARQPRRGVEQAEPLRPDGGARRERQDLAPLFVKAEGAGRGRVAGPVQMVEQGVHRRRPRPGGTAHGVAHAHHPGVGVSAGQLFLFHLWNDAADALPC